MLIAFLGRKLMDSGEDKNKFGDQQILECETHGYWGKNCKLDYFEKCFVNHEQQLTHKHQIKLSYKLTTIKATGWQSWAVLCTPDYHIKNGIQEWQVDEQNTHLYC